MAAIIFLMNTLTGCALKNENMEAIYKEFLDNGDVGSLQWSWVLEPGQYEDIRFVNDNMVAVQNGSDKWQFMLGTGKIYGLKSNSLIDEMNI